MDPKKTADELVEDLKNAVSDPDVSDEEYEKMRQEAERAKHEENVRYGYCDE